MKLGLAASQAFTALEKTPEPDGACVLLKGMDKTAYKLTYKHVASFSKIWDCNCCQRCISKVLIMFCEYLYADDVFIFLI